MVARRRSIASAMLDPKEQCGEGPSSHLHFTRQAHQNSLKWVVARLNWSEARPQTGVRRLRPARALRGRDFLANTIATDETNSSRPRASSRHLRRAPRTTSAHGPLPGLHDEIVIIDQYQFLQRQGSFTPPRTVP